MAPEIAYKNVCYSLVYFNEMHACLAQANLSRGDSVSIDRRVVAFVPLLPFYILPLQRQKPEMSIL